MLRTAEINQIKKVLTTNIENETIAGGNLLVLQNGKEIFYHEEGLADREEKTPVRRDSIFRLYSMTKPVTATAMMILLERGEVDLYDPVSKYLKGFKDQKVAQDGRLVPVEREMILKDLLSMTSGLVYGGAHIAGKETEALFQEIECSLYSNSPLNTIDSMNRLGKCPLAFHPGTSWEYGASADVLGAVVEIVSGKRFGEFLADEIFKPLKMEDTGFWIPEEKRNRLAQVYENDETGSLQVYAGNHLGINNKMDRRPAFESGGAGLVSTVDDYAKFAGMLLQGGNYEGKQILKTRTVKYLTSATLNSSQQNGFDGWLTLAGYSYGNLMRVLTDCSKSGDLGSPGEYGWDGWLGAYFCNCPNDELTILLMMQKTNSGTTALTRKLRNIILSSCCR